MISVILYGRNDDYGYNLHKRASLSINCIAAVLTDPDDEILFVDYNTADDFPTFPEAIRDTLTETARQRLRILRVRPEIHRRYAARTHLSALEPISRNIAIRRSNPANRWILSTNTDMIFVLPSDDSLTEIAADLPPGFYHTPRFDVPESLWETFDRMDPAGTLVALKELGETAHLNEIVLGADHILYDAPGDFQLVERQELFEVHGYCEDMLLGWHVDSNLAKRLYLRHGKVGDLAPRVRAYHCEHTRAYSNMHYTKASNDLQKYVFDVAETELLEQAESWGCSDDEVEEIALAHGPSEKYLEALTIAIDEEQSTAPEAHYLPETFNHVDYDARHVLPYLTDVFVNCPRRWSIGWFGGREETLELFARAWRAMKFTGDILVDPSINGLALGEEYPFARSCEADKILVKANAFVFDVDNLVSDGGFHSLAGIPREQASKLITHFLALVAVERNRCATSPAERRRVVLINAIGNDFEILTKNYLDAIKVPFTSRLRHGFVSAASEVKRSLLPQQLVGEAGEREGDEIRMQQGRRGHIFYGPYTTLLPGRYRVVLSFRVERAIPATEKESTPLVLEVTAGARFLAQTGIEWRALDEPRHILEFDVADVSLDDVAGFATEVRLWSSGALDAAVTALEIETLAGAGSESREVTVRP